MDDTEIERMARLEAEHWWYRGLRHLLEQVLRMPRFRLPRGPRALDAGCGTGENLRLLNRVLQPSYLGGFDVSATAVRHTQAKLNSLADVYVSDIRQPDVHVPSLDLVVSCDVLTIPGMAASRDGVRRLVAALSHGGLLVLHVAALRWLYSSHDVVNGVRERFSLSQVERVMSEAGLKVELISYRVFWLFPALLLRRLPSMVVRPSPDEARSDLTPQARWLNEGLLSTLVAENQMLCRGTRFPWGSSLFAVGRKECCP